MDYVGTCSLEEPYDEHLCYYEDKKYLPNLLRARNMVVLTRVGLLLDVPTDHGHKYVIVDNPRAEFCRLHNKWYADYRPYSESFELWTSKDKPFTIHPGAVIGRTVRIGHGSVIMPNVTIYNGAIIGENCVVNSGSVIGAEGFSSLIDEYGNAQLIRNVGYVRIGNNVTIGANNCIDRGTFKATMIGDNVKTDNFVHIAHNCRIGDSTRIAPMTCIAGSCTIGKRVWISVGVSIKEHTVIGDDSFICMGSSVIDNLSPGAKVAGNYAMVSHAWMKHFKELKTGE